jgi:hypothetical protein
VSFSYDASQQTALDQVRFMIGDIYSEDPQMQDEEIVALLASVGGSPRAASVLAVDALIARYARQVDKWVGDLKILASQRYEQFVKLKTTLQVGGGDPAISGIPTAGGVYVIQNQTARNRSDLIQGAFRKGMHDH